MFCLCGNLIFSKHHIKNCDRCQIPIKNNSTNFVITKIYKKKIDKEIIKSKGAKIKYTCAKCGNDEMTYNTIQSRSADEGQTVFYTCDCGYKEKINS